MPNKINWDNIIGDKQVKNSIINRLYEVPPKESKKTMPHFQYIEPNITQQADILFLPDDKQFKYVLLVVDVGSRLCDGVALKNKDADTVLKAFKRIYNDNDILEMPMRIEVDDGGEFKSVVANYFKLNNVFMRIGKVGRHRQQGIVERWCWNRRIKINCKYII